MIGYIIVDLENRDIRPYVKKKISQYKIGQNYILDEEDEATIYDKFFFYSTIEDCVLGIIGCGNCIHIMKIEVLGDIVKHETFEAYYTNSIHVLDVLDNDKLFYVLKIKIKNLDILNKNIDTYDYETVVNNDIQEFLKRDGNYVMIENILYQRNPADNICRKVNLRELKDKMYSDKGLHSCLTLEEAQHYIELNEDLAYKVCEYHGIHIVMAKEVDKQIRNYFIDKWIETLGH